MIKLSETIIVEGKYDKIKLISIFDANVIEIGGFNIYRDKETVNLLRRIADRNGVIIITDSDSAGFRIRNYLKNVLAGKKVYNVYIPEIKGREKRKITASKEGFLGVEAMEKETLIEAFQKSGINISEIGVCENNDNDKLTKADLYKMGLYGKENSREKRREFLKMHGLPEKISSNVMLDILNSLGIKY